MSERPIRDWQDFIAGLIHRMIIAEEKGFTAYLTQGDKVQLKDLHHELLQIEIRAQRAAFRELEKRQHPSSSKR